VVVVIPVFSSVVWFLTFDFFKSSSRLVFPSSEGAGDVGTALVVSLLKGERKKGNKDEKDEIE
jgi:hypothetical protein